MRLTKSVDVKRHGFGQASLYTLIAAGLAGCLLTGCASPTAIKGPTRIGQIDARYAKEAGRIEADPVAYLRKLYARCGKLAWYRLTFYRQERLGTLLPSIGKMETMRAAFRAKPFSVQFEWDDPESDYYESVYVEGQNDSKLIVRERKGIFPFPPQVRVIDPALPQQLGKARNPITNFGLAQVTGRIVKLFDDPEVLEAMTVTYEGVVELEPMNRPAHHIHMEQPHIAGYPHTVRDFYVDAETLLPAGVDLWIRPEQLDARYRYADIDTEVTLTDDDFRLSKNHPK